jgi:hypothetical protein
VSRPRPRLSEPSVDDGFLGKADPVLIQALLAEAEAELAFREGRSTERFDPPEPHPLTKEEWATRDYVMVQRWRHRQLAMLNEDPNLIEHLYGSDPIKFICHWLDVYEPRNAGKNLPTRMPFILFKRQEELVQFYHACLIGDGNGLVEKSRDMGATWCGVGYSIWLWRFIPGTAVGWGSAKSEKLDRLGDAGSIFEKIRLAIRGLPKVFLPPKFKDDWLMHKRVINHYNGCSITGDIGDDIGRGGRTRIYFVDEAAYVERPEAMEGALSENTRCQIHISSVSGPGTVFHRTRQSGAEWTPGKPIHKDRHNVFLMDWSDHPEKSAEWLAQRKKSFDDRGLGHVFAREIERNYAAAQEGSIIKPEWVDAAFDAHKKLNRVAEFESWGKLVAGLDVGDETGDANAGTIMKGRLVKRLQMWKVRDTAITARKMIDICRPFAANSADPLELQYDCIGLGAGIKAETNRLRDENLMPPNIVLVPWNAGLTGVALVGPHERVVRDDPKSPANKDFYGTLKAQAWWNIRTLLYNTWRAVTQGEAFPIDQLIAFDCEAILSIREVDTTILHKIKDELSQVVSTLTTKMKVNINKAPTGTQSPNLADSLVMAQWPVPNTEPGLFGYFGAPIVVKG